MPARTVTGSPPGDRCRVKGARCQAITGGAFDALAGARCTPSGRAGAAVELTSLHGCQPPTATGPRFVYAWATNIACAAATGFALDTLLAGADAATWPCGGRLPARCGPVGGFTCTITGDVNPYALGGGFRASCLEQANRFHAIELVVAWGVFPSWLRPTRCCIRVEPIAVHSVCGSGVFATMVLLC